MKKSHFIYTRISIFIAAILLGVILSGCGPSQTELDATATQVAASVLETQTAAAPSSTPSPTITPTAIPTATPTPTPEPDASAMLAWEELDLPPSFEAISPDNMGVQEGAIAFGTTSKTYYIANSFVFFDIQRGEGVFGYTVDLSGQSDIAVVDNILSDFKSWSVPAYAGGGRTLLDSSVISGTNNIGDKSSGIRIEYMGGGNHIVLKNITFRIDDIYVVAIVKNFTGTDPLISVSDVARVYASSIQNPVRYCQITHISQVEGATWPSYDFVAEGFYPGEARMINLTGAVQIGGEPQSVRTALLGLTGETADGEGHIEGNVTFRMVAGEDVTLPDEFLFSILGYFSECEVSQIVPWSEE